MDVKKKKFYLGSHAGDVCDGYVASNRHFLSVYKKRPETCRRRILETVVFYSHAELLARETAWLSLIKEEELFGVKYYNQKRVAAGGDIVSSLPTAKKTAHKDKSIMVRRKGFEKWLETVDKTILVERAQQARSSWTDSSYQKRSLSQQKKIATLRDKNGNEMTVENIHKFCKEHGLNYGNVKTMLRGNGNIRSCSGWTGRYAS